MLKIENYKKLVGLKFGDWTCGLATEHETFYRFSFQNWNSYSASYKDTYWIELNRTSYIDADGDEVYPLGHPNRKVTTIISKRYVKSMDRVTTFFNQIIRDYAAR
jgi:hypothetical protein